MDMNDNEALQEVHDILAEGWCKGALHKNDKGGTTEGFAADRVSSCMLGAIELAAQDSQQETRLQRRVSKAIARLLGDDQLSPGIPGFNDQDSTSHEDVLLVTKYAMEAEQ